MHLWEKGIMGILQLLLNTAALIAESETVLKIKSMKNNSNHQMKLSEKITL